jgi:hypothetical protein
MSFDLTKLVADCIAKTEEGTHRAQTGRTIRRPQNPMAVLYLGEHAEACKKEVAHTLRNNWPVEGYKSIETCTYLTPEDYRRAIEYNEKTQEMELEELLIRQCGDEKSFAKSTDVMLVYFLNLNGAGAEEFVELLNQRPDTRAGGQVSRVIFAMNSCLRTQEKRQVTRLLGRITELAHTRNEAGMISPMWQNTRVVALSNSLYSGGNLRGDQIVDSYALAAELLQICNSTRQQGDPVVTLPSVMEEECNLITGALRRKTKPTNEIVRTVLREYVRMCQELCRSQEGAEDADEQSLLSACNQAILEFYHGRIQPALPQEQDLMGLPNHVTSLDKTGYGGGADETCGVWGAFLRKHFIGQVDRACGSQMQLEDYFADYFSKRYSCSVIKNRFHTLANQIRANETKFYPNQPGPQATLVQYGVYTASYHLVERALPALVSAVQQLSRNADDYLAVLSNVEVELNPQDETVKRYYSRRTRSYLEALPTENAVRTAMKRPCEMEELEGRMRTFYGEILSQYFMRLSFEEELNARITDKNEANNMLADVLSLAASEIQNWAQMPLNNLISIGDLVLLNKDADYAQGAKIVGMPFHVSRTDGVDRIALYKFQVNMIL